MILIMRISMGSKPMVVGLFPIVVDDKVMSRIGGQCQFGAK